MQVDTIDYLLRQSSLQRLRHTKHDKSSETYTDNIKKTLKTYNSRVVITLIVILINSNFTLIPKFNLSA